MKTVEILPEVQGLDDAAFLDSFRLAGTGPDGRFEIARSEALFGWREISPLVRSDMDCLEIGAGAGLLAALVARRVASVVAVEPVADGFVEGGEILTRVEAARPDRLEFSRTTFEMYPADKTFDLIWSVNVFEHLSDWQAALEKAYSQLKPGGQCIILCPNYSIPYEPHFSLPLFVGPKLTRQLFRRHIEAHEASRNAAGLWDSLNFIKAGQVLAFCREHSIPVSLDDDLLGRMFTRIQTESNLRRRHGLLRQLIGFASRIRLTNLVCALPPTWHPYSGFHITRPSD